jgi:single-stranded DNA-binding protein
VAPLRELGDYAAKLTKGSHVHIEGEIRTRNYEVKVGKKQADVKKSITEVRVFTIEKLDRAKKSEPEGAAA